MDARLQPVADLLTLVLAEQARDPKAAAWLAAEALAATPGIARVLAYVAIDRDCWHPPPDNSGTIPCQ